MTKKALHSDAENLQDSPAAANLGDRLRARRREIKLTLQTVADRAGLSVGFISQIERGITQPSLASLASVAQVLDLPLSHLLSQPGGQQRFTTAGAREVYGISDGASRFERLSSEFVGNTVHSLIIHEPPGHRIEPIRHAGEEMIYVLKGEITVEVDGDQRVLREGDSVHHPSDCVHSSWNHGDEEAKLLWVGTFDVFGGEVAARTGANNQERAHD
ncbi:MAG: XRE family transcriptional regulator [Pseudomonadota bacterium]